MSALTVCDSVHVVNVRVATFKQQKRNRQLRHGLRLGSASFTGTILVVDISAPLTLTANQFLNVFNMDEYYRYLFIFFNPPFLFFPLFFYFIFIYYYYLDLLFNLWFFYFCFYFC